MAELDDELTELAAEILAAQPFSQHVGTELEMFREGEVELSLQVQPHHLQQFGLVHGGVFGYLADVTVAFTGGSVLGPSVVSTRFAVDLVGNIREGTLRSSGRVVHMTDTQAECSVEILASLDDGTQKVCATATGTVVTTQM